MKVAVITPYHNESYTILSRCHASVASQTHPGVVHIFVSDGTVHPCVKTFNNCEHIVLSARHDDAGATPRAIGALSAFSRGYDAVAFLDADNTISEDHVAQMAAAMESSGAMMITATRNICTENGEVMYTDLVESNGKEFCDTNCMFLGRNLMHLLPFWITDPSTKLWSDRRFWSAVVETNIPRAHVLTPTVNYHSRWAWHYHHSGRVPPPDSVWIDKDPNGNLVHKKHSQI